MQATDTTAIQRLIARARRRIRGQWAIEGATTATVIAAAMAAATIVAMRVEAISPGAGIGLIVGAGFVIAAGAVLGAMRRLDDETVARRIDRASNLSDRLSTAIAFDRTLASGRPVRTEDGVSEDDTVALMHAAIVDGVRAVPRANVVKATPFVAPRDWRAALGFLAASAIVAGLSLPGVVYTPSLFRADPDFGAPGQEVLLHGENLLAGAAAPRAASLPADRALGTPGAAPVAPLAAPRGFVPDGASVYIGPVDGGQPVHVLDWSQNTIKIRIPENTPLGETLLVARIGGKVAGPLKFTVVDPKDERFHKVGAVMFDPEERAYIESLIARLELIGKRDGIPELEEFAKKIRQMLADAEEGKISKEKLLEELAKAEEALKSKAEPAPEELAKDLAQIGKELAKEQVTKELGKALEQNDLEKAKEEMEKLANKLDEKMLEEAKKELEKKLEDKNLSEQEKQKLQKQLDELKQEKPLTEQQKEQLQKQLEQAAKKMEQQQKQKEQQAQQQQQKLQDEIRRLQKEKDQAKSEQEKLDAERRLQKKQDELKQLQKNEDQKKESAQRDAIKRLQKDIEKAAEQLQKPQQQESEAEKEQRERQASQKLKDAARETGKVDQDKRKQAAQKKISSQMDDLREAMQRAKQKGNKGPQDPFNKQGKNKDFAQRARGQQGQGGQAWKPGQGQQPGGQGQQPGGQKWGTGHDPNLTADPTGKSGNTKDQDLQGKQGKSGSSTRETILAAAQKGFASRAYKDVYQKYNKQNEEVMRNEKLPSSYKYFVKRYFAKIHPSAENTDAAGASELEAPKSK